VSSLDEAVEGRHRRHLCQLEAGASRRRDAEAINHLSNCFSASRSIRTAGFGTCLDPTTFPDAENIGSVRMSPRAIMWDRYRSHSSNVAAAIATSAGS